MAYLKHGQEPPATGKGSKISQKMLLFVDEYMLDLNGSAAVLRAGYKTRNAHKLASELLQHPLVRAEIEKRTSKRREKLELTADYVLTKLVSIVEDTETGNVQAALRGLELLGKHLGLFKERTEISGPDGNAIQMEQKVNNDVADFTSRLSRLARTAGTGEVVEFPKPDGQGET